MLAMPVKTRQSKYNRIEPFKTMDRSIDLEVQLMHCVNNEHRLMFQNQKVALSLSE